MRERLRQTLKEVKKIEIKTNGLVEGLLAGEYHSVFKGRGIEFSEVREYVPGDDVRAIDWNVTARMNFPFIKEFIEERDLPVYIVFDVSASQDFGYSKSKKQASAEIAASLMFAAVKNNDPVSLCLFSDHVEKFIPPKKGKKHVMNIIFNIISHETQGHGTDISSALDFIGKIAKRRGIVFIISDFFSKDFIRPLRIIKRRHDTILINIKDEREEKIPDIGYAFFEDDETGEQFLIDTSDPGFREAYEKLSKEELKKTEGIAKKLRVDIIRISTGEPYEVPIRRFFRLREKRMIR